jgi:small-conductance mechanosensitive channel
VQDNEIIRTVEQWMDWAIGWMTSPIFTVGEAAFSVASVAKFLVFLALVFWLSRLTRRLLEQRALPRLGLETGISHALANIAAYTVVAIGLMVGLQASGINMGALTVLFGAVGVGIGFGLQTIASNFISGLILLIERPIQVGDRIQRADQDGRGGRINIRATEVITNDDIAVIVPNSDFISQQVINWSHGGDSIRSKVPIGEDYGSDIHKVKQALLEAAAAVDVVLKHPGPRVRLKGFGDSSIDFELLGWTSEMLHRRGEFISRVNFAIHDALAQHGIVIPFPQRDLHLKSSVPLPVVQAEKRAS